MNYYWTTIIDSGEFVFWKGEEAEVKKLASKFYKNKMFDMGQTSKMSYERSSRKGN